MSGFYDDGSGFHTETSGIEHYESMKSFDLYVVKSRRFYGDREVTSVLCAPTDHHRARANLDELIHRYQEPGNLFLEKFIDGEVVEIQEES